MTSIIFLGFLIGIQHALEADHVAAVASLATRNRSIRETVRQGVSWGLGHALTLFLFGGLVVVMDTVVPEHLAQGLELAVGFMLVLLGLDLLRQLAERAVVLVAGERSRLLRDEGVHEGAAHDGDFLSLYRIYIFAWYPGGHLFRRTAGLPGGNVTGFVLFPLLSGDHPLSDQCGFPGHRCRRRPGNRLVAYPLQILFLSFSLFYYFQCCSGVTILQVRQDLLKDKWKPYHIFDPFFVDHPRFQQVH